MRLVEDRVRPGHALVRAFAREVEIRVDDDAFRHKGRRVPLVKGQIVTGLHLVAENGRIPDQVADVGLGVGVEQQLIRVEAVAVVGFIRPMDAIAVTLSGFKSRNIAVPHFIRMLRQHNPLKLIFTVF
jgi:hypothetical protein